MLLVVLNILSKSSSLSPKPPLQESHHECKKKTQPKSNTYLSTTLAAAGAVVTLAAFGCDGLAGVKNVSSSSSESNIPLGIFWAAAKNVFVVLVPKCNKSPPSLLPLPTAPKRGDAQAYWKALENHLGGVEAPPFHLVPLALCVLWWKLYMFTRG